MTRYCNRVLLDNDGFTAVCLQLCKTPHGHEETSARGLCALGLAAETEPVIQTERPARITPEWLWGELMDWCKTRTVSPSAYNDLFGIVKKARDIHGEA